MYRYFLLPILFLTCVHIESFSQISTKGIPPSFSERNLPKEISLVNLTSPEKSRINIDKPHDKIDATPLEIGYTINTKMSLSNSGDWYELANGNKIWRLSINSDGAEALNVYFTNFYLPDRSELYIYNQDRTMVLGAYNSDNNSESGIFSTELLAGDQITLELVISKRAKENATFTINEIGHVYQYANFSRYSLKDLGDSGSCEVNVNCEEGDAWQKQKRGVARIVVKRGNSMSWCSGTLLNNVNRDFTPYFYTANHCGQGANETDYMNWVFYFNYEADGCENPTSEPVSNTITGSQLLSTVSLSQGSDFKLLLLQNELPTEYNPYFNGWSTLDESSQSGVTIHHPWGDIKKISTYVEPLESTNYDGNSVDLTGSYWKMTWSETINGHGVTEGGSSGAPLFNSQGLVIGALTGGGASCDNLFAPDYFGKLAHSWDKFATNNSNQLKLWLDPNNTGATSLSGFDYNDEYFIPEFHADTVIVPVGKPVNFTDLSIGNVTNWEWTFTGADVPSSNAQHPRDIVYSNMGEYDVSLEISNGSQTESITKTNYIRVIGLAYPVPSTDSKQITIYLGTKAIADVEFILFDEMGREVGKYYSADAIKEYKINVSGFSAGFYFIKIQTPDFIQMIKIVIS